MRRRRVRMPAYPILLTRSSTSAGRRDQRAGYKQLLQDLLRARLLRHHPVRLGDYSRLQRRPPQSHCCLAPAAAGHRDILWVSSICRSANYVKGLQAGLDQFGGTDDVQPLIDAVTKGEITEARLDESVVRSRPQVRTVRPVRNPYADPEKGASIGLLEDVALAERTQREQAVAAEPRAALPVAAGKVKAWLFRMDPAAAKAAG